MKRIKSWLNRFHIWRFHLSLWEPLNDKPCFHFSYQPPGYWTPIDSPEAKRALMLDDELGLSPPKANLSGEDDRG